jgi:hypothetical protein
MSDKVQFVDSLDETLADGTQRQTEVCRTPRIKKAAIGAASRCSFCCRSLYDDDPFVFVKFSQHDFYDLALFRGHQLANVIRLDGQLAMFVPAIDQNRELHAPRPAEINQLVQRRAHRATRVKHIVNQDDTAPFDIARQFRAADNRFGADRRKIVTIQSYVENAYWRALAFEVSDFVSDAIGQRDAATANTNQDEIRQAVVFFYDLGSQPCQRAIDTRAIHYPSFFSELHWREIVTRTTTSDKEANGIEYLAVKSAQAYYQLSVVSFSPPIQSNCRTARTPIGFLVPKLDALYYLDGGI